MSEADIGKRVEQFVKLRDKIKAMKDRHEEELKPLTAALMQLNGILLNHLNASGTDSIAVRGVATAYRSVKKSASIADGMEFKRFVIGGEHWDMIDWKANAGQVEEYLTKNNTLPPGVNFSAVAVVNVRKT